MMRSRSRFTLIELLVVMALAAILVTLALPAFDKMINGDSVAYTSSTFKHALQMAQSRALTNRRYVAVLVDYKVQRPDSGNLQAIRLCFVDKDPVIAKKYNFKEWLPEAEWVPFDSRAYMVGCDDSKHPTPFSAQSSLPAKLGKLTTVEAKEIVAGSEKKQTYYAVVFSPYGNVALPDTKSYFLIGEAVMENGQLLYPTRNSDGTPANTRELSLNQFTGKMEFIPNEIEDN